MSNKRTTMRKLREILRLRLQIGLSIRAISRSTKLSVGGVQKLLSRADALSLTWPLPAALDVAAETTSEIPRGLRIADLNQDGLSDMIYFVGKWGAKKKDVWQWIGDWYYRLSTGTGWTDAVTLLDTPDTVQAPSSPSLHDDNGDGYNDKTTTQQGAKLSTVTTTNTHDNWGNPTGITVTTEDHANGKRFRQVTENTYGSAGDSKRYGRLIKAKVTRRRDETADDTYETTGARTSTFSYYPAGTWEHLLKTETLEPNNAQLKHETTYHYDAFGHRIRAVVKAAEDESGRTTGTRCDTDTAEYDTHGRYAVKAWDCLGQARRAVTAHNGWGRPTTVAQFLSAPADTTKVRTTTHTYTPGGGLAVTRESTGAFTGQYRAHCTGSVAHCPAGARYYIESRQAGGGKRREYRDTLDMNGRIYDPKLGRFMQADPVIQFPHYSQGQNTYSYVLNNPLTYTDPSGHFIPVFTAIAVGLSVGLKVKIVTAAILIGTGGFADSLAQGVSLGKTGVRSHNAHYVAMSAWSDVVLLTSK